VAKTLSYSVLSEDVGLRLDALAAKRDLYPSRSAAVRFIEDGKVFVNGSAASKKHLVELGDYIVYEALEEAVKTKLEGQDIPLDIRFEDEHLMVISKQAGLVCHPSPDHSENTLVNALIFHCGAANLCNVQGQDDRLGIVHRLDMDTSGLMIVAKSDEAGEKLMAAIRDREVDRRYLTLVHGNIAHNSGMIDAPIARSPQERTRMCVIDSESARDSITTFKVLQRFEAGRKDDGYNLLECKLFTGRTHQIRVHMHYIKHPVVGDSLYGSHASLSQLDLKRQFLHSYRLEFEHPITGESMQFVDGLAKDFHQALEGINERLTEQTEEGKEIAETLKGAI
jgi:23S rRNA pseudouridine1911/1915/1917 synthase